MPLVSNAERIERSVNGRRRIHADTLRPDRGMTSGHGARRAGLKACATSVVSRSAGFSRSDRSAGFQPQWS